MRKIISFMHISLDGFVAGPNGEMDWIKVDEEIFDHIKSFYFLVAGTFNIRDLRNGIRCSDKRFKFAL